MADLPIELSGTDEEKDEQLRKYMEGLGIREIAGKFGDYQSDRQSNLENSQFLRNTRRFLEEEMRKKQEMTSPEYKAKKEKMVDESFDRMRRRQLGGGLFQDAASVGTFMGKTPTSNMPSYAKGVNELEQARLKTKLGLDEEPYQNYGLGIGRDKNAEYGDLISVWKELRKGGGKEYKPAGMIDEQGRPMSYDPETGRYFVPEGAPKATKIYPQTVVPGMLSNGQPIIQDPRFGNVQPGGIPASPLNPSGGGSTAVGQRQLNKDMKDYEQKVRGINEIADSLKNIENFAGFKLEEYNPATNRAKFEKGRYAGSEAKVDLPGVNIPGFGRVSQGPGIDPRASRIQKEVATIRNIKVHELFGASQTANELRAAQQMFDVGDFASEEDLITALKDFKIKYRRAAEDFFKSQPQEVQEEVRRRGITIPSEILDAPIPKEGKVKVISPEGKRGSIPEWQLEGALKKGYKIAE